MGVKCKHYKLCSVQSKLVYFSQFWGMKHFLKPVCDIRLYTFWVMKHQSTLTHFFYYFMCNSMGSSTTGSSNAGSTWYIPVYLYCNFLRLKKINHMSQSCRAFVFRCAFDSAKSKVWNFFACLIFFFSFLWAFLSKYTRKDMTNTMKHFEQQTSSTLCSVLYLAHPKIKFHISKLWPTQIWHVCCSRKKKKKTFKKTAFRSGLPICHELWDIAFIFFSLILHPNDLGLFFILKKEILS